MESREKQQYASFEQFGSRYERQLAVDSLGIPLRLGRDQNERELPRTKLF